MRILLRVVRRTAAVVNGLCVAVLFCVLGCGATLWAAGQLQQTDAPTLLGYTVALPAQPAADVPAGALVLLRPQADYTTGSTVAWRESGQAAFGYLAAHNSTGWRVRPARESSPISVPDDRLLGAPVLCLPRVGAILAFARTPRGLLLGCLLGVLLAELPAFLRPRPAAKRAPDDMTEQAAQPVKEQTTQPEAQAAPDGVTQQIEQPKAQAAQNGAASQAAQPVQPEAPLTGGE